MNNHLYGDLSGMHPGRIVVLTLGAIFVSLIVPLIDGQSPVYAQRQEPQFADAEWAQVDNAISRAVDWLANVQQQDGSLPTMPNGQPGITSLGVLAMMAQGELPGHGQHGDRITLAIDYVLSTQQQNGLLALVAPNGPAVSHQVGHRMGQTAVYNHAISGLMLTEAYATTTERSQDMQAAIEDALKVTLAEQTRPKRLKVEHGGWRYLDRFDVDDVDLSIIGWQLKFLRSAKNAGFEVPDQAITDAVACIKNHFNRDGQSFAYTPGARSFSRAMNGAGILALAHAGMHDTPETRMASQAMLKYTFSNYNGTKLDGLDRYHYSVFQCTQAAYQMGDDYWHQFYPRVFRTLLANQNRNGSWPAERTSHGDSQFGSAYTTALVVLSLSAPNQLLPIYQR